MRPKFIYGFHRSVLGGLPGRFCVIGCQNIVLIQKGVASSCGTCSGFIDLLANMVHECRHQKQNSCSGGFPDETTAENDATTFTAQFLSKGAIAICDSLIYMGVCQTPWQCYGLLSAEEKKELGEVSS